MGISSRVNLAGARLWVEALLTLVSLSVGRLWAHPSLGRPLRLLDRPLDFWALGGPVRGPFDPYSLSGKRVLVCLGKANCPV